MSRRRVLFVLHCHPAERRGGAQNFAYDLFRAFRTQPRYEPFLLVAAERMEDGSRPARPLQVRPGTTDEFLLRVEPDDYDWFFQRSRSRALVTRTFADLVRQLAPDVVHFQHLSRIGFDAIRQVRNLLPATKVVFTLHEFQAICASQGQMVRTGGTGLCRKADPVACAGCFPERGAGQAYLREQLIRSHLGLVDVFLAPSRHLLDTYVAWGIPRPRIGFLDYGRTGMECLLPRPLAPGERRNRFAFLGQVTPFKGVLELMRAFVAAARDPATRDLRLTLHATGLESMAQAFRSEFDARLAAAKGAIRFAGPYAPEQLPGRLAGEDWVVVPSTWWENSPLVIQEAFGAGRPVLCSGIGGMAEKVRDGVDGLHFTPGDPASILAALTRAASTPGLWEQLREARPPVYPMEACIEHHAQLYDRLRAGCEPAFRGPPGIHADPLVEHLPAGETP